MQESLEEDYCNLTLKDFRVNPDEKTVTLSSI